MHNADVMIREDVTTDDVIDAILGNRKYVPCLCVSAPFYQRARDPA